MDGPVKPGHDGLGIAGHRPRKEGVDGRVKRGHDGFTVAAKQKSLNIREGDMGQYRSNVMAALDAAIHAFRT